MILEWPYEKEVLGCPVAQCHLLPRTRHSELSCKWVACALLLVAEPHVLLVPSATMAHFCLLWAHWVRFVPCVVKGPCWSGHRLVIG